MLSIAVVIPVLEPDPSLARTIKSLDLIREYLVEVIVVNSSYHNLASQASLKPLLSRNRCILREFHQDKCGPYKAQAFGAKMLSVGYTHVLFLNSGDCIVGAIPAHVSSQGLMSSICFRYSFHTLSNRFVLLYRQRLFNHQSFLFDKHYGLPVFTDLVSQNLFHPDCLAFERLSSLGLIYFSDSLLSLSSVPGVSSTRAHIIERFKYNLRRGSHYYATRNLLSYLLSFLPRPLFLLFSQLAAVLSLRATIRLAKRPDD